MIKSDIINNREADALLDTIGIWANRHRHMTPAQRCSPDVFDDGRCVDDLTTLHSARRWWFPCPR